MTLSESLKRFRSDFNLSQKNVAERLGIKQQQYYRYETGETVPAVSFIVKLADAFDVSTDYLLGRRDTPKPNEVGVEEVRAAREFKKALKKFIEVDDMKGGDSNDRAREIQRRNELENGTAGYAV